MDIALIQTSMPDTQGYVSLGVSVDIVKAAVEKTSMVIAQINSHMPRVHGDSFLHIRDIDYIVRHDEPLIEYHPSVPDDIAAKIGSYVSRSYKTATPFRSATAACPMPFLKVLLIKKTLACTRN